MRKIYLMPLISLLMLMMLTGCSDDQTNDVAGSSGNVTEVHFTPLHRIGKNELEESSGR